MRKNWIVSSLTCTSLLLAPLYTLSAEESSAPAQEEASQTPPTETNAPTPSETSPAPQTDAQTTTTLSTEAEKEITPITPKEVGQSAKEASSMGLNNSWQGWVVAITLVAATTAGLVVLALSSNGHHASHHTK